MRKSNREIKDKKIIERIFANAQVIRIAFLDGDLPYIVPMNFGYDGQFLYLHSAPEGKKMALLKKNKTVCFELEEAVDIIKKPLACSWTASYRSIIGYGRLSGLSQFDEKRKGLEEIMRHYGSSDFSFSDDSINSVSVLKMDIIRLTAKQSPDLVTGA